MISDMPLSHYEYVMPHQELHLHAIYNMIIIPWNITIIDLYSICKSRPEDSCLMKILENSCEIRQQLVEIYNLREVDEEFETMMDIQGIHDFIAFG
jgi:hypothetical protein